MALRLQVAALCAFSLLATSLLLVGCSRNRSSSTPPPVQPGQPFSSVAPTLDPVVTPTNQTTVRLTGRALQPQGLIRVEGGAASATTTAGDDRRFAVQVDLFANRVHRLFVTETVGSQTSPPATVTVVQDSQVPRVFIDFPGDGDIVATSVIDVVGRVSDTLSGALGLRVDVNGVAAAVTAGVGTNGSFSITGLPLVANAPLQIVATASDMAGNQHQHAVTVTWQPVTGNVITALSGNYQEGRVGSLLPQPLVVQVTRPDGSPFAGKPVTFEVTRNNGLLAAQGAAAPGQRELTVITDANGVASASWRLGSDAGRGNNRVGVRSRDMAGTVHFVASATPGPASQINIGSGNQQVAAARGPTPAPLQVWVSDGCNGVADVPVLFKVVRGGGTLTSGRFGLTQATVRTDATGHAAVGFELGPNPGNHVVEAMVVDQPALTAQFTVLGLGIATGSTSFAGTVIDNAERCIEGATCTLQIGAEPPTQVTTDAQGRFLFANLPAAGLARLDVDGATATAVGGTPLTPGGIRFPALHYEPWVIRGAENRLVGPVRLPVLDPANDRTFDGSADVTLTVAGISGLQFTVGAGTRVLLRDGSVVETGSGNSVVLSLNQVHADDVPMPMRDGAAPPFSWTLQPAGAVFDPPLQLSYPNMTGLPPGSISYFLSFDHDTGEFEIVASGAVSADGASIVSDRGSGLSVAGWGCNCPPYSVTGECKKCEPEPNGCGPAWLGPIGPWLGNCFLVEGPLGSSYTRVCFTPNCNQHDICYGTKQADKAQCDQRFFQEMMATCDATFSAGSQGFELSACYRRAALYYLAVSRLGGSAYQEAQEEVCRCLEGGGAAVRLFPGLLHGKLLSDGAEIVDVDGDLMDDAWELQHNLNPADPSDGLVDLDGDQLVNLGEFVNGYNPRNPDTDGNGTLDGAQVASIQEPPPVMLDQSWSVSVNGQTVPVDADGRFEVRNVSAADAFGAAGPGSPPDFVSDDSFRAVAVRTVGGSTLYAYTEPFRIQRGQVYVVPTMTMSTSPPPVPVALAVTFANATVRANETVQATATATLADGSTRNVTPRAQHTTWRCSNPAIATISEDGLVTGVAPGVAMITATNEGAAAVGRVVVTSAGDPLTTLIGFVELLDGTRVEGVSIAVVGLPQTAVTAADGSYTIPALPTAGVPQYDVRARVNLGGQVLLGTEPRVIPVPGGITDAGVITLDVTGGFGPIILSGMDPEDHGGGVGGAGWTMIRDVMRWVVENSALSANPTRVLQLGGTPGNAAVAQSAGNALGYTVTHRQGNAILTEDFMQYDALYMPTTANQAGGGLTQQELGFINQRGADIIDFVNAGGGLVAFSQEYPGAYQWFPLTGLTTRGPSGSSIELTPAGQFILSPSATAVLPFHTAFTGPAGFFGMDVLAREGNGLQLPLILGGIVVLR